MKSVTRKPVIRKLRNDVIAPIGISDKQDLSLTPIEIWTIAVQTVQLYV
jgi:hypothetical protein